MTLIHRAVIGSKTYAIIATMMGHQKIAPYKGWRQSLGVAYRTLAILLFNVVVLLIVANVVAFVWLSRVSPESGAKSYPKAWLIEKYGFERLAHAYPGWNADALRALLYETSNWFNEYEPFTQFRQRPRQDRYITITEQGFRPVPGQGPWPPDPAAVSIFVFGGSTTMGAGLPDHQTIPAYIQALAARCKDKVHVYNFGRGYYFSTQERILFEQFLLAGLRPNAAIFIDGLNDFYYHTGVPQWTPQLHTFMDQVNGPKTAQQSPSTTLMTRLLEFAKAWPLTRLLSKVGNGTSYGLAGLSSEATAIQAPDASQLEEEARAVIRRWKANRRVIESIAGTFGIKTAMIFQPVPTYGYDLHYLNVFNGDMRIFEGHQRSADGYRLMAKLMRQENFGVNFLWLGDLQRNRRENLYVDAVHYTAAFSEEIATRIFQFITKHNILACTS